MYQVTQILNQIAEGDRLAVEELWRLVYDELRGIAAAKLSQESPGHTLQPTALVHESYLRLLGPEGRQASWESRGHFFAAAAEAMRRIHDRAGDFLNWPLASAMPLDCDAEAPGTWIGSYKLIEQIGEGGMGTVYLAEQRHPVRRQVALKIIKPGMDSKQVIARFEAEQQALARMDHPNIAKVFDGGNTLKNRPYFVMELVRGVPITTYCDKHKLSIRERLELLITVCHAVQHAHQKGIIHRDLKPNNILVELHDVVSVPKVIDFGIAKATEGQLSESTLVTGFAQFVGTPMYMSPEQLELSGLDVDTRSDVYALGVLLYELLVGHTPFDWSRLRQLNYDEMRRILRDEEPPRPSQRLSTLAAEAHSTVSEQRKLDKRQMIHHLRGELDWIVVRALEKDRSRRYGSAADLAEDIGRYLRHEPLEAGPPSTVYRFKKYARRHRVALLTSITLGMALLLLLVAACVYSLELRNHNRELAGALSRLETSERREHLENYAGQIRLSEGLLENRQFAIMHESLAAQKQSAAVGDLCGFEWRFLWAEAIREPRPLTTHHPKWAEVQFSADGTFFSSIGRDLVLNTWEATNGRLRKALPLTLGQSFPYLLNPKFTRDGTHLLCMGSNPSENSETREFTLWDVATGRQRSRHEAPRTGNYEIINIAPDGRRVAYVPLDFANEIRLWNTVQGQVDSFSLGAPLYAECLALSADGKLVSAAMNLREAHQPPSFRVETWDVLRGFRVSQSEEFDGIARDLAFSPDNQSLVVAPWKAGSPIAIVLDAHSGAVRYRCEGLGGETIKIALSADGKLMAIGSHPPSPITFWDFATGKRLPKVLEVKAGVASLTISPDNQTLVVGGNAEEGHPDADLYWCSLRDELRKPTTLPGHPKQEAWSVAFSPDSQSLAVGYDDEVGRDAETLKIWNVSTGKEQINLSGHGGMVSEVQFLGDGTLASASFDQTVALWDIPRQKQKTTFLGHTAPIRCLAVSSDGSLVASAGKETVIRVWDVRARKERFVLKGGQAMHHRLAFDPQGKTLASADNGGVLCLWDMASGKEIYRIIQDTSMIIGLAFRPDGSLLATGNYDGEVKLYDLGALGNEPQTLFGHKGEVRFVAFSPDGKTLASGGDDGTVRLWQVETGRELLVFRDLPERVNSLAFSPDGQHLAAAIHDGSVRIWHAPHLD